MYRRIPPSSTLLLNEQSALLEQGGKLVFRFGFGQSPFPVCSPLTKALVDGAHRKEYTPVQGLASLREKVASYHANLEQRPVTADQVFIAPGSKALLYTIMCAYSRLAVIIPAPAWVSYAPQAELIGHDTFIVRTDYAQRYRMTPKSLEQTLIDVTKHHENVLVVLNSPGNPDGLSYSKAELKALSHVLDRYRAMVISDEIYGPLHHQNQHVSMAKYYPQGTFVTSGLSKWAGAGGWRLGIAILPQNYDVGLKDAMLGVASETYSCAAAPIQHAALTAYSDNAVMQEYVHHQRVILRAIGKRIHQKIIGAGLRAHAPQGGFYILVDFSPFRHVLNRIGLKSDTELCRYLLQETGVALLPGVAFGLPTDALSARLAFVDFDGSDALHDIAVEGWTEHLTDKHTEKMCLGISRLQALLTTLQKN